MKSRRLADVVTDAQWLRLGALIAESMGLHFPPERLTDLQRGLAGAADEFGFDDAASCIDWLLSAPPTRLQLEVLAGHLTIGETYFFREKKTFEVLATRVLPGLIDARRGRAQRLRLWSAACCTGEEAYSLAILLGQVLPDLADWHVTILATDINARFIAKAAAGVYGEWSFRDVPPGYKERYFNRTADGRYAVRPDIKQLVTFEHLNLVQDSYPSLATDTNAMDVVFCRNALMYFTPSQTGKVIDRLRHALVDGGWLVVSPSEASQVLFSRFATHNFPGVILFQKSDAPGRPSPPAWLPPPPPVATVIPVPLPPPRLVPESRPPARAVAASLYEQGRYGEAVDVLLAGATGQPPGHETFSLLARALANQGRLDAALVWCDRWVAADKMDAAGHYLRAAVLLELGRLDDARRALQSTLYLDPAFALAHFTLGNLARSSGQHDRAGKHFRNALTLLGRLQPGDVLPESDGLTAGRLMETITTMTAVRPSP